MRETIKDKLKLIRESLTSIRDYPIGKAVLTVVIFLDLFILISIFQGLDDHVSQLISPNEYIPQQCRSIVIDGDWNESNTLYRTANSARRYQNSYVYRNNNIRINEQHALCVPISKLLLAIPNDKTLKDGLSDFRDVRTQFNRVESDLKSTKGRYDTYLLEVLSNQSKENEYTASLKKEMSELRAELITLSHKDSANEATLMQNENIRHLFNIIANSSKQNKDKLIDDLHHSNFWYPVKRLAMEIMFLLPLFSIFYLWNFKSQSRDRPYQRLVSSHLLVIVFIPIIFKLAEFVYDILPKKILRQIIELLESFNLVAIWHYVMMGVAIGAVLILINFMQKRLFSREKTIQKRIMKEQCQNCGSQVPRGNNACSICGFKQFRQCGHCHKDTYVYGKYCKECGSSE